MFRPGGHAIIISEDARDYECDTFTCVHCNRVVHVKPKANPDDFGSMCRNCMKMVCPTCASGPCTPWLKKIEEQEERSYRLRCYGV